MERVTSRHKLPSHQHGRREKNMNVFRNSLYSEDLGGD